MYVEAIENDEADGLGLLSPARAAQIQAGWSRSSRKAPRFQAGGQGRETVVRDIARAAPAPTSPARWWRSVKGARYTASMGEYEEDSGLGRWGVPRIFTTLAPHNVVKRQVATIKKAVPRVTAMAKRVAVAPVKAAQHKARVFKQIAAQKAAVAMQVASRARGGQPQPVEYAAEPTFTSTEQVEQPFTAAEQAPYVEPAVDYSETAPMSYGGAAPSYEETSPVSFMDEPNIYDALPSDVPVDMGFEEQQGGDNMNMMPSEVMLPAPSNLTDSGMGDIWGDLMKTGLAYQKQKTTTSIAQSQAAQADALARAEAARAMAATAPKPAMFSTPMMLGAAAGLGLLLVMMRRRR